MAEKYLAAYLNDHLAGSVLAIDLLTQLEEIHVGTDMARDFCDLRADIEADREELKALMNRLEIAASRSRKASGWSTARVTEVKLRIEDDAGGPLRLLESMEVVALGIDGKHALWCALAAAAENAPQLAWMNYDRLVKRAEEQRRRAEGIRLSAAKKALA